MPRSHGRLAAWLLALSLAAVACTAPAAPEVLPASAAVAREVSALPEDWSVREVEPGFLLYEGEVVRGEDPAWSVSVTAGQDWLGSRAEAEEVTAKLAGLGWAAEVVEIAWPEAFVQAGLALGWKVVLRERYATRARAEARAAELGDGGWRASVEWSGAEPYGGYSRTRVVAAVLDPAEFRGSVEATFGERIDAASTVAEMAREGGALFAVNGGYFVMEEADGVPGTPAGIGVYGGRLESEAVEGRAAVVLEGDGLSPSFVELSTEVTVSVDGRVREAEGVNRVPGVRRNCVDPRRPTRYPLHDVTCRLDSELVVFTDAFRGSTPETGGVEAVADAAGVITSVGAPGAEVPAGGHVVQGVGGAAAWLEESAEVGERLRVDTRVVDSGGGELALGEGTSVVNAGPRLVSGGLVGIDAEVNGLIHPDDPRFGYAWALRGNPRMAMGVDGAGRLLLVGASGRAPGESDGFGLEALAGLMRDLGAVEAVALDGGGSVSMVLDGEPVLLGVSARGERSVGDAVLVRAG
ncbi:MULTISPECIES: phosphodiester glycosidase family protein [unclassified Nocardiopsis]|uniref:phosphodiester glycosidase family protein n=1 Tax=unclassified Nocardiopsis TaxID=2649073 RepID=UPI0013587AB2|nr:MULTISPECIES: phosphodiester glycosidase family protein [unclassified Nocardiopsis]